MAYHLEGRLLEVCDCRVLCPCWIGEDPDNGTCDTQCESYSPLAKARSLGSASICFRNSSVK